MAALSSVIDSRTFHQVQVNNVVGSNHGSESMLPTCSQRNKFETSVISVQNVCKSYDKRNQTLCNLSMEVNKGTIYGLLGSSGCGKTTLLSCIVGLRKWDTGKILLFGRRVNGTPGNEVGYMPQEVALHGTLSIRETITYFGHLYGMRNQEIEDQWAWIVKFLQLPTKFSLVKNLSGGQQRRVSLAVTLIHSPELLILDEPTVGMDPLLRESIWEHLKSITATGKATVIITTHYIEEARSASKIGLIRNGRLLVEDTPTNLLQQNGCVLLEEVVLKLCTEDKGVAFSRRHGNDKGNLESCTEEIVNNIELTTQHLSLALPMRKTVEHTYGHEIQETIQSNFIGRITALSTVICLMFIRNSAFMFMIVLLPTFQIMLTLATEGIPPKDLKFGIVNKDVDFHTSCGYDRSKFYYENVVSPNITSCSLQHLSCRLVSEMSKSDTFSLIPMESIEVAQEEVELGNLWGYFAFPSNYSQHLSNLGTNKRFAENVTLEGSRVHLFMDMSNYLITAISTSDVFEAYERFTMNVANDCGLNPAEFQIPMTYREPTYGKKESSLHEHFIPIVLLGILFEITVLMTSVVFINDRKQGVLSRALVAGVHFNEVLISHMITQSSIVIAQTLLFSIILHFVYDMSIAGSYIQLYLLCFLGGLCGQSLGMLHGVIFEEEVEAIMISVLILICLYTYEGCFWPMQGMTVTVRNIANCLPTTLLVESIRSTIYRGVGVLSNFVWPGILMAIIWTIVFWSISILVFRRKLM